MAYEWLHGKTSSEDWIRSEKESDVCLSQFGFEGQPFRNRPRLEGRPSNDPEIAAIGPIAERDLSMIEGRLSAREAGLVVLGRSTPSRRLSRAIVRYFRVGVLWEAEFGVYRSPNKRNPDHVSVVPSPRLKIPHGDLGAHAAFWDTGGSSRLDSAQEEVPHE